MSDNESLDSTTTIKFPKDLVSAYLLQLERVLPEMKETVGSLTFTSIVRLSMERLVSSPPTKEELRISHSKCYTHKIFTINLQEKKKK